MLAYLQSIGSSPEVIDCWKIAVIAGASSVALGIEDFVGNFVGTYSIVDLKVL
ncbi:hypothetical protein DPMN_010202 [Dreissena polymorpha]|uniref:Uncharacterized protein n=1 Tax=Dreissena polymorpha TaxID=45954 RepID=A0A9D4RYZ6_DREPO|nr:hypothetical protein DPMN_010202 [Dreissena polymorpha]